MSYIINNQFIESLENLNLVQIIIIFSISWNQKVCNWETLNTKIKLIVIADLLKLLILKKIN